MYGGMLILDNPGALVPGSWRRLLHFLSHRPIDRITELRNGAFLVLSLKSQTKLVTLLD